MHTRTILVLLVMILCLFGCKKKQGQPLPYYKVPEELKTACLFGGGSYWIYKNDSTGATDSIYIDKDKPYVYDTALYDDRMDEVIINEVRGNILDNFKIEGGSGPYYVGSLFTNIYAPEISFYCGYLNAFSFDQSPGYQGSIFVSCGSERYPHYAGSDYFELGEYQDYPVNNLIFDQVELTRAIYLPNDAFPSDKDTVDFYFSPEHGFVKLVLHVDTSAVVEGDGRATESWSLLRYSVKNY
jgi:hypothetical protein